MYDLITYITQYLEYESYISSLTMLSIKNQRIVKIQRMNLEYQKYCTPYIIENKQSRYIVLIYYKHLPEETKYFYNIRGSQIKINFGSISKYG